MPPLPCAESKHVPPQADPPPHNPRFASTVYGGSGADVSNDVFDDSRDDPRLSEHDDASIRVGRADTLAG